MSDTASSEMSRLHSACAEKNKRIAELEAEVAALRKDAARYRWLRSDWDNRKWRHLPYLNIEQNYGFDGDDIANEETINAAIDAAIASQEGKG